MLNLAAVTLTEALRDEVQRESLQVKETIHRLQTIKSRREMANTSKSTVPSIPRRQNSLVSSTASGGGGLRDPRTQHQS